MEKERMLWAIVEMLQRADMEVLRVIWRILRCFCL